MKALAAIYSLIVAELWLWFGIMITAAVVFAWVFAAMWRLWVAIAAILVIWELL